MRVVLINPNSTEAMTHSALATARQTSPDIQFEGWTSHDGPAAIEGPEDGAAAVPPMLTLVQQASNTGAHAIILACFDDTGLSEAQKIAACPVIGIGQASFVMASLLGGAAAVITTVDAAVPVIKANIETSGHAHIVREVRAAQVPVLQLDHAPGQAADAFAATANGLPEETQTIILGCSGAVTILEEMRARFPQHIIDGVTAAAKLCRVFAN